MAFVWVCKKLERRWRESLDVERYKRVTASFHLFAYHLIQTAVMRSVFGASKIELLYTNAHAGKKVWMLVP